MNRPSVLLAMILSGVVFTGCNRRPSPPPPQTEATTQPEPPRPTTQQLLNGPYKVLPLADMPLVVKVPEGWKIDSAGPITFLTGPTPAGQATIQISSQPFHGSGPQSLLETARADANTHPANTLKAELRDFGNGKIFEKITLGSPQTNPKLDEKGEGMLDARGNLITVTFTPVHWTIGFYQPQQTDFMRYELDFIDLSLDQYNADKDFLNKIVGSLMYTGAMSEPATKAGG